jgi:hypothetical protein
MDEERLVEALRQIKSIVDGALGERVGIAPSKSKKVVADQSRPESLPDHILALRGSNFFTQPKTYNEVHAKLQTTYPCNADRVKVACLRLQKRKQLRKASKLVEGKSQVAYVW